MHKDLFYVTLTVPRIEEHEVKAAAEKIAADLMDIKTTVVDFTLSGPFDIKAKLEASYNRDQDNFLVHVHLVVEGKETADIVMQEFLKRNQIVDMFNCVPSGATAIAQDIRNIKYIMGGTN